MGYQLLTNIMASRIGQLVEKKGKLRESQEGFRKKRETRDHIFVLNSMIRNKLKNKGKKLYAAFIDFKTAFDVIDRGLLIEKLKKIGINGKMLNMIRGIYKHTRNEIMTGEGITKAL